MSRCLHSAVVTVKPPLQASSRTEFTVEEKLFQPILFIRGRPGDEASYSVTLLSFAEFEDVLLCFGCCVLYHAGLDGH